MDIGKVFVLALAFDAVYQFVVYRSITALDLLLTAALLALVPYVVLRGLVTHLARRR